MDALRANAELVSRLTVQRWIGMKVARERGASLERIGRELGVSRQSAWEFMQRRIAEHGGEVPLGDAPGAPAPDDQRWELLRAKIEAYRERGSSGDPDPAEGPATGSD
jgi:hypothetical protein